MEPLAEEVRFISALQLSGSTSRAEVFQGMDTLRVISSSSRFPLAGYHPFEGIIGGLRAFKPLGENGGNDRWY